MILFSNFAVVAFFVDFGTDAVKQTTFPNSLCRFLIKIIQIQMDLGSSSHNTVDHRHHLQLLIWAEQGTFIKVWPPVFWVDRISTVWGWFLRQSDFDFILNGQYIKATAFVTVVYCGTHPFLAWIVAWGKKRTEKALGVVYQQHCW